MFHEDHSSSEKEINLLKLSEPGTWQISHSHTALMMGSDVSPITLLALINGIGLDSLQAATTQSTTRLTRLTKPAAISGEMPAWGYILNPSGRCPRADERTRTRDEHACHRLLTPTDRLQESACCQEPTWSKLLPPLIFMNLPVGDDLVS
jgi:hypothetical protein